MLRLVLLLLAVPAFSWGCSESTNQPAPTSTAPAQSGDVRFSAAEQWVAEPAGSTMRVAQYRLPPAEGDGEDASLVIFYFGRGQGGSVQANLDRWIGQLEQPDGRPSRDLARTEKLNVNGLEVTLLDVSGTYTAETSPGSGTRLNNPNYRLRAAVIETPKGPYFVKLVGPAKTVDHHDTAFEAFIRSFEMVHL